MYAWIWRKLPFGVWGKLSGSLVLTALVGSLLWYVIFPWATPLLPFDDVQVSNGTQQGPAQEDPNAVVPGGNDGPDAVPYSTHSNDVAPSPTVKPRKTKTTAPVIIPGD
jgi:cytoskeletal protein RodZ